MKICIKCGTKLSATTEFFFVSRREKYGVGGTCKPCMADYNHQRYLQNKEQILLQHSIYYQLNFRKCASTRKAYSQARPEQNKIKSKKWKIANKDHIKRYEHEYRKSHSIQILAKNQNRRAIKKKVDGKFTQIDIEKIFKNQEGLCAYCSTTLEKYHIDHVIPITRNGTNFPDNLALTCGSCNSSKQDKILHNEWAPANPIKRFQK